MPATTKKRKQARLDSIGVDSEKDIQLETRLAVKPPKWQDRLLPIMVGLLIGLAVFFFISSFFQMSYLHSSMLQTDSIDINPIFVESAKWESEQQLNAHQLEVRSRLEAFVVRQRYRQASALLMAGLWVRYLGFITGMILSLVGASFVLGKLREPPQRIEGKFSVFDFSLRTASPGIILVVLGVLLMFTTIVDEDTYYVTDKNVYFSPASQIISNENYSLATPLPLKQYLETPSPVINK